ncbi:MAG: hypothetical protein M0C28_30530 [Candidatus Moduliflexus flocculans]|nr:hypothetical protein [Candidatus Moduliflexus flocculans]
MSAHFAEPLRPSLPDRPEPAVHGPHVPVLGPATGCRTRHGTCRHDTRSAHWAGSAPVGGGGHGRSSGRAASAPPDLGLWDDEQARAFRAPGEGRPGFGLPDRGPAGPRGAEGVDVSALAGESDGTSRRRAAREPVAPSALAFDEDYAVPRELTRVRRSSGT